MSKNVTKLWGREFNIVKDGLSEDQVVSFVDELVSTHEMLIQRQEHLSVLTKLAERTVTEAENLSEEIKREATDRAKAEASKIIAEAEDRAKAEASRIITEAEARAQQIVEEKQAEAMAIATEHAEAIKAKAKHEAELLLGDQRKRVKSELSNFVHQLYNQLLSELESLKQQVVALEAESEHKLSQSAEETSIVTKEGDGSHDEFMELIQTIDQTNTDEPEWELEILPPTDIMKMMGVVTYLDQLPEVERTEIIPRTDMPSIMVFLREPISLADMLRTLPEVAQVKEDATDTAGANGKPRKVQIVLAGETVPQEGK